MKGGGTAKAEVDRADGCLRRRQDGGGVGGSDGEDRVGRRFFFGFGDRDILPRLERRLHFAAGFGDEDDRAESARVVGSRLALLLANAISCEALTPA